MKQIYFYKNSLDSARMKKLFMLVLFFIAVFTVSVSAQKKDKILVFAKTQGYFHSSIPKGIQTIMNVCTQNGIKVDTTRDAGKFTLENLKQYKAVVFLNTSGNVFNEQQQEAFTAYIRSGGGYVGVHAATDTEYEWPWYNKLAGAYFLSHPQQQEASIKVIDKNHPATAMLPDRWVRTDEWYNFKDINQDIKVLAWLDESSYKGGANGEKHPFIWCHEFNGGRAFYTGVGHRDDNYDELLVQKHLLGAIKWAAKIK